MTTLITHLDRAMRGARRCGLAIACCLFALAAVGAACFVVWSARGRGADAGGSHFATTAAWKGPYDFAVVERGIVECGSSIEIRSLIRRSGGTTILEIVPEGSLVQPGDILVELDSSGLRDDESAQKIVIATRQSLLAEAENTLAAARIAKTEYLKGLFVAQEMQLATDVFVAERGMITAEATLESAKALHQDAVVSSLEVEAAHAGLEDAGNKVDASTTALTTLRGLTRQKELALLQANVASAEANLHAQRRSLRFQQERLRFIEEQIAQCTLRAPAPGQVVYANESSSYGSSQSPFVVAPGVTVRERQAIIWLPNPRDLQVKVMVNEARITLVNAGMPASIRVAAAGQEWLEGEVVKVSQYAEPSSSSINIRKYATTIKIENPPADLRIGMNAEAQIHVERMENALQVPVQAFAESHGRYYSVVKEGDHFETREIEIQSTNDRVAVVEQGLAEGDEVLLNPRSAGGLLELPDIAEPAWLPGEENQPADVELLR